MQHYVAHVAHKKAERNVTTSPAANAASDPYMPSPPTEYLYKEEEKRCGNVLWHVEI